MEELSNLALKRSERVTISYSHSKLRLMLRTLLCYQVFIFLIKLVQGVSLVTVSCDVIYSGMSVVMVLYKRMSMGLGVNGRVSC